MKSLNIDAFATVTREISFGGHSYPVEETNVQQFIDNLKAAEALEASESVPGSTSDIGKHFEQAIIAVRESVPTMPESIIRGFKIPAMTAVLQFIRGELDGNANTGTDVAVEGAAEKKQD